MHPDMSPRAESPPPSPPARRETDPRHARDSSRDTTKDSTRSDGLFLNRELSWLEFNSRVLDEATDPSVPLGERFKFQSIVGSNLDEFFMVRVAGLKQLVASGRQDVGADGMSPRDQLAAIGKRVHALIGGLYRNWKDEIEPGLREK